MGPQFDLAIIRIGRIGNKHKYVPGLLWELCQLRADEQKATWIITEKPWAKGHPAWGDDLATHVAETFGEVSFAAPTAAEPPEAAQ